MTQSTSLQPSPSKAFKAIGNRHTLFEPCEGISTMVDQFFDHGENLLRIRLGDVPTLKAASTPLVHLKSLPDHLKYTVDP